MLAGSVDLAKEYLHSEELSLVNETHPSHSQWAILHFEKPITAPLKSLYIASRLDTDIHILFLCFIPVALSMYTPLNLLPYIPANVD